MNFGELGTQLQCQFKNAIIETRVRVSINSIRHCSDIDVYDAQRSSPRTLHCMQFSAHTESFFFILIFGYSNDDARFQWRSLHALHLSVRIVALMKRMCFFSVLVVDLSAPASS